MNPYVLSGPEMYVWPRGYPISLSKAREFPVIDGPTSYANKPVHVIQIIKHIDPDVDAVWRL